jgi:leucyl/phenylalanyl-tRNA--protein transferase
MAIYRLLDHDVGFPSPISDEVEEDGLLAVGGDLSPQRLLNAYRQGIFPWFNADDPLLWWSPPQRAVVRPAGVHCSRSTRKDAKRNA